MTKRFALYIRISTDDQKQGESLKVQEEIGRKYVASLGGEVVKVFRGDPESGTKPLDQRPRLQAAIAAAQLGQFDAIWFLDHERFGRSPGTVEAVYPMLFMAKVKLHIGDREQPFTPETEAIATVLASMGRLSARKSRERTRMSREKLLSEGANACGRPPFGRKWNKQTKAWEIDKEKQKLVDRAFRLYMGGKSMKRAAEAVGMANAALTSAFRLMSITRWERTLQTPEGTKTYVIEVPALMPPECFELYRQKALKNSTIKSDDFEDGRKRWLLQGVIRCGACGGNMSGQWIHHSGKRTHAQYRHLPMSHDPEKGCCYSVPAELIEPDVLYACSAILESGDKLKLAVEAAMRSANSQSQDAEAELVRAVEHERACVRRHENFLEKLAEIEGPMTDALKQKMKTLNLALDDARSRRAELAQQVEALRIPQETADAAMLRIRQLIGYRGVGPLTNLTRDQQRDLICSVVGRLSRAGSEGIFVKARKCGPRARDLVWHWELRGSLATVAGASSRYGDLDEHPRVKLRADPSPSAIRRLAELAEKLPATDPNPKRSKRAKEQMQSNEQCS